MNNLRQAAQQALEALEDMLGWQSLAPQTIQESAKGRAAALKAALAEPVQEPVAWWKRHHDDSVELNEGRTFIAEDAIATGRRPLVFGDTAPPQRKPLTEDVATELVRAVVSNSPRPIGMVEYGMLVARAVERAHRIE